MSTESQQSSFANMLRQFADNLEKSGQGSSTESAPPAQQQTPAQRESAPPAAPYSGQKFEYKVVYVNFRGQISSEGAQVNIGSNERRSTFVREYLDDLGAQGWELAGVSPLGDTENSYFVFKRPAQGSGMTAAPATSTDESTMA